MIQSDNLKMVLALLLFCASLAAQEPEGGERISFSSGSDPNIRMSFRGGAGNIELGPAEGREGYVLTQYQEGSGSVYFDRAKQVLEARTKIAFTVNRISENIMKKAPYMRVFVPNGAELDFDLDVNSVGIGSLNFENMHINQFKLKCSNGDVDVNFPTPNEKIVRGKARFSVGKGDLEIENLGNLKATDIYINGGIGQVDVNFGPQIYKDTLVKMDHDIGELTLVIPKGTKVMVKGTSRDLAAFGFIKRAEGWQAETYDDRSPLLEIRLKGPIGSIQITWE